ncbi:MAG: hypothetical protein EXR50_00070 [Dehalococcoidia bacterium]|nr:hypothetical protein [Dehalococcoidia bacterium]
MKNLKSYRFPRALGLLVLSIMALLGTFAAKQIAIAAPPAITIPSGFFTLIDTSGANDVNGQVDLTRMGRDDTSLSLFKLFWSWDSVDFAGQTGDACALFDFNGNGKIDVVVCGQIENAASWTSQNPVIAQTTKVPGSVPKGWTTGGSPFVFRCDDKLDDRCGQPSAPQPYSRGTDVTSGTLNLLVASPNGNLVTDNDPFPAGDFYPSDSTLHINITNAYLQSLAADLGTKYPAIQDPSPTLVNVCAYPSAGNVGNNNPFDCFMAAGTGFLNIRKVVPDGTSQLFNFTVEPGTIHKRITGAGTTGAFLATAGTNISVAEIVPAGWQLDSVECGLERGKATGIRNGSNVSDITVEYGRVTTCTFTNSIPPPPVLPTLAKGFSPAKIAAGGISTVSIALSNPNPTAAPLTAPLVDTLPAGVVIAGTTNAATTCGAGVVSASSGGGTVTLTGGSILAGSAGVPGRCTVTVDVAAPLAGVYTNILAAGALKTSIGESAAAVSAMLTVGAARLNLVKTVTNDNGGTALATDWTLTADGTVEYSGAGGFELDVEAGTYILSESTGPAGYAAGSFDCGGSVTLVLGESKTCTINSDDIAPKLTVNKVVVTPPFVTKDPGSFKLMIDGVQRGSEVLDENVPASNLGVDGSTGVQEVMAGTVVISETVSGNLGSSGLTENDYSGDVECTGTGFTGGQDGNGHATLELSVGAEVVCTITNILGVAQGAGTLTINKVTVGGDGTFDYSYSTTTSGTGMPDEDGSPSVTTVGGSGSTGAIVFQTAPGFLTTVTVGGDNPNPANPNWGYVSLVCADQNGLVPTTGTNVVVAVPDNGSLECTYTNSLNAPPPPAAGRGHGGVIPATPTPEATPDVMPTPTPSPEATAPPAATPKPEPSPDTAPNPAESPAPAPEATGIPSLTLTPSEVPVSASPAAGPTGFPSTANRICWPVPLLLLLIALLLVLRWLTRRGQE